MKKNTQEEMKKFQEEMKNIQEDMKKIQGKVEELNFCKGKDKKEAIENIKDFCWSNPGYNCEEIMRVTITICELTQKWH